MVIKNKSNITLICSDYSTTIRKMVSEVVAERSLRIASNAHVTDQKMA